MHRPVLYHEIIHALRPRSGGLYVDGTLGAGGHAAGLLHSSRPDGRLLGMDVDPQALTLAQETLAAFGSRVTLVRASYTTLSTQLAKLNWRRVDGILLDLGASSMQFDVAARGFSFRYDAPLDMRFDPDGETTAADLVNNLTEAALADILYHYGEERRARRIAKAICQARPMTTTGQLAELVVRTIGKGRRTERLHPATRTFQALRIAVNKELEAVESVLPQAVQHLSAGGRLAVISFHSLEDRIVKRYFRREGHDCLCPPEQPICTCGHKAVIREVNRKPIRPQAEEINENPRARSARLRVAEKLDGS